MQLVKLELLGDARCSEGGQYASHEDTRNTPGGQILHGGFSRVRLCQAACAVSQLGAGGTVFLGCNEERLVGRTFSSASSTTDIIESCDVGHSFEASFPWSDDVCSATIASSKAETPKPG